MQRLFAVAVLAVALRLAACGGTVDDDDGASPDAAPPRPEASTPAMPAASRT